MIEHGCYGNRNDYSKQDRIVFTCILGLQTLHKYLLETSYM